jgi:hypothetical protein
LKGQEHKTKKLKEFQHGNSIWYSEENESNPHNGT